MTRKEAIAVAVRYAHASKEPWTYLENIGNNEWRPHDWVVDAIVEAGICWVIVKSDKYGFHYRTIAADGTFGWSYVKERALQFKKKEDAEANAWNPELDPVQVISL